MTANCVTYSLIDNIQIIDFLHAHSFKQQTENPSPEREVKNNHVATCCDILLSTWPDLTNQNIDQINRRLNKQKITETQESHLNTIRNVQLKCTRFLVESIFGGVSAIFDKGFLLGCLLVTGILGAGMVIFANDYGQWKASLSQKTGFAGCPGKRGKQNPKNPM